VLDNLARGPSSNIEGLDVEFILGDVRHPEVLARAIHGVEAIIHLAAFGSVVESVSRLQENFDVNVGGTVSVLRAAAQTGVKVVFASSGGAVIGVAAGAVDEQSLPRPMSPYGASKLCGEAYCHAFASSFGLQTVALRFANVYGPFSAHKRGAVTNFITALMSGEPIGVFGDGSATRDFIYVDDLCDGIYAALRTELPPGIVLHLATGIETTVARLASTLARVAGQPQHPIRYSAKRPGELERNFANFARAHELLGFSPLVSLEEGLLRTWRWFQHQPVTSLSAIKSDS